MDIPTALKHAIAQDNLILFVGAGLSYDLQNLQGETLQGWGHLVKRMLDYLQAKGHDVDVLLPLIPRYDPLSVLELIEGDPILPKKDCYDFAKEFLDLDPTNDWTLHQKLYQLSNKIITTNYDNAFELAEPQLRRNTAHKGKNYELTKHKEPGANLLFKLHGCAYMADSMVLFPSNYQDLYANPAPDAEHSLLVLKNIMLNKTLLFLGTGMGDFQINTLFQEIKTLQGDYHQPHFILSTEAPDSSLDFLTHLPIDSFQEIGACIDQLLLVKEASSARESSEITALKKQLAEAHEKIAELASTKDQKHLLDREATKYFVRGVEYSLSNQPKEAIEEYTTAVELKPDYHEAYYNWGTELGNLAATKTGREAEALYEAAFQKYAQALAYKPDFAEAYTNWGANLGNLAVTQTGREAEALYQEAFEKFEMAIAIKPDDHKAYYNWGTELGNLAATQTGGEAEALYKAAFGKFEMAIEYQPDDHEAYNNWGNGLGRLAATQTGEEAEKLYRAAFQKYAQALTYKPDKHQAHNNWGANLGNLAATKTGGEAEALYEAAFEKYAKALVYQPDDHEAYNNWGNGLGNLADTKTGEEAEELYRAAFEKYAQAIAIKPDYHEAYNNWGANLGNLADTKTGEEAEALYRAAFEKYAQALAYKPDFAEAYNNWGIGLGNLAATQTGEEAEALYQEAIDKQYKAIEFGASTYNLGCLLALTKDQEKALHYLALSLEKEEISVARVEQDEDWAAYREDEAFIALLHRFRG